MPQTFTWGDMPPTIGPVESYSGVLGLGIELGRSPSVTATVFFV